MLKSVMGKAVAVATCLAMFAGVAIAQTNVQPRTLTRPAVTGQSANLADALRNRPQSQHFPSALTGSFTQPPLTAAITNRKLAALRALGLSVQARNLGASTHLTPMRHTVDSTTYLAFSGSAPILASAPATQLQGSVTIPFGTVVEVDFRAASPFAYHLVECITEAPQVQEFVYTAGSPVPSFLEYETLHTVQPAGAGFAVLVPPLPSAERQVAFMANYRSNLGTYVFAGCEVTPVNP